MNRQITIILFTISVATAFGRAAVPSSQPAWDLFSDTWVATDGLGRTLPTFDECGPPKPDKTVGMFYYLWHDSARGEVRDNAKALLAEPDAKFFGMRGEWHWWGEPLLGYYLVSDPFVQRTHASMLTDAGIDTVVCDVTNAFTYPKQCLALCSMYESIARSGQTTPKIGFITHSKTAKTTQALYDDFYSKSIFSDLWFLWDGKPLLMTVAADVPEALRSFFAIRGSWAWHRPNGWFGDGHDRWAWIDDFPQQYGWHVSPEVPEELSVAAAMHASSNVGRSFHDEHQPDAEHLATARDPFFDEQWSQALKVSPRFLFITNFNEWIAQAQHNPKRPQFVGRPMVDGQAFFVDEYSPEFSRDIEPAAATDANRGVDDNCYYQMVANIRRYKGVRPLPEVSSQPISMVDQFNDWSAVQPEFRDTIGDAVHRDYDGFETGSHFLNDSGRNDFVASKVSEDAANIYFYVRTAAPITPYTDHDWMLLYLDADHDRKTGWMGYDFIVNHSNVRDGLTTLKSSGPGVNQWKIVSDKIQYHVRGNEMEVAIPRSLLQLPPDAPATIDFKWADHCYSKGDWTDFILNGDAAPNGRFNYRAKLPPVRPSK